MVMASTRPRRALLNLFFAGILGLVLPFICWGAQATPGHPHARAHFVFWPPEMALAGHAHSDAHLSADAELPSGQATPSVLAIFLLLLITLIVVFAPRDDIPGFTRWQPALYARWIVPHRDLPPPRCALIFLSLPS